MLYGIALKRGLVPPPEASMVEQFPEYPDLIADPERRKVTIGHALNMTTGLEWDENKHYSDPTNSEIAMEMAQDRYRFILERPIVAEPGAQWTYSGGSVARIIALIARGAGMSISDFAREALFAPMGITDFRWAAGRTAYRRRLPGCDSMHGISSRSARCWSMAGGFEGQQLVPEPLRDVVDWLADYRQFWDESLDRLGKLLGRPQTPKTEKSSTTIRSMVDNWCAMAITVLPP